MSVGVCHKLPLGLGSDHKVFDAKRLRSGGRE
jgi:hypothetical protein